jgi:hypothetical protein
MIFEGTDSKGEILISNNGDPNSSCVPDEDEVLVPLFDASNKILPNADQEYLGNSSTLSTGAFSVGVTITSIIPSEYVAEERLSRF